MEATRKVLIVDKSIDRKKRIAALKGRGWSVFPALRLADARSRCRPGAYDLVIVNAQDEPEAAVAFCEELGGRVPAQAVLLAVADGAQQIERTYSVTNRPEQLAERAASLLDGSHKSDSADLGDSSHSSARVSA